MTGIRITGWGIAVPDKVVTNDDMAVNLDTSDEWIVERTGIRERHIGGTTSGLAIEAAQEALACAGRTPEEISHLVLATTTPDGIVPGTAPTVQHGLGTRGGAFDINAACSGFVYGLVTVAGLIAIGSGPVLLIGSETLSRITDMDDRKIAIIVGDGAGAVVVEPVDGPGGLLSWNLNADGSLKHLLKCEHGGTLFMDGKEVFRRAVRVVVESAERAMADAGLGPDDISLMVPHQANVRIIQAACAPAGHPRGTDGGGHRPLRQHLVGLHPAGALRRHRERPRPRRRQPPPDRLRRRDDLGERRLPLERMSDGAGGAGLALVVLAAGRAKRYGGVKPLAPVGSHGEAVIDLVASDALDAGFDTIVLVLGPSTGPAIRYHVEHTWPSAVDVRFATQSVPRGTVDAVLSASDHVGDAPYGVGNADDIYGRDGCTLLAEHLRSHGDANALVGYRLADAVIGFSPVTRGICRVGADGHAPRRRRAAPGDRHARGRLRRRRRARAGHPVGRRPGVDEPVGLHAGVPQDAPGGHGRRRRRLRGDRGAAPRGGRPVARRAARSPCCRPRAAASG